MGQRVWFYQTIFYSKGLSILAITICSHCAGITWSFPLLGWKDRAPFPGSITIPLPRPDAASVALCPHMRHRDVVCPVPSWVHLWYSRRKPTSSPGGAPASLELAELLSKWVGIPQMQSAKGNQDVALFHTIRRRCPALLPWLMLQYPQSPGTVWHRPILWCRLARNGAALMHMPACSLLRRASSVSRPSPFRSYWWFSFVSLWLSISFLVWISIAINFEATWFPQLQHTACCASFRRASGARFLW
jgi:hypothetical protein